MQVTTTISGSKAILKLVGRFDFYTHRDFRNAYESMMEKTGFSSVEIDMSGVDYLDSSALGMLLMVREKGAAANRTVSLTGVRGSVKQVLDIANFGKLFSIE